MRILRDAASLDGFDNQIAKKAGGLDG